MNDKNKKAPEKEVNRYVFVCIALIMYLMPCLSCLVFGISAAGGMTNAYIFAIVTEVLSAPLGFLGISAMKKPRRRLWCILYAAVLIVMQIVCAFLLGSWYWVMAPTPVLLALMIPWSSVVDKLNR